MSCSHSSEESQACTTAVEAVALANNTASGKRCVRSCIGKVAIRHRGSEILSLDVTFTDDVTSTKEAHRTLIFGCNVKASIRVPFVLYTCTNFRVLAQARFWRSYAVCTFRKSSWHDRPRASLPPWDELKSAFRPRYWQENLVTTLSPVRTGSADIFVFLWYFLEAIRFERGKNSFGAFPLLQQGSFTTLGVAAQVLV